MIRIRPYQSTSDIPFPPQTALSTFNGGSIDTSVTVTRTVISGQWRYPHKFTLASFVGLIPFSESPIQVKSPVPFSAAQQQSAGFVFVPPPTRLSVTPSPELFIKPLNAAQQRFADNNINPLSTTVTPSSFSANQSPDIFAKPFTEKKFDGIVIPAAFQPRVFSQNPDRFGPLPFLDRKLEGLVSPPVQVTTPLVPALNPELFVRPLNAAQQRFPDFAPAGTIVSITPQGWWGQSPDRFAATFPVALQRFADAWPAQVIAPATTQLSVYGQSIELFVKPFPVVLQRFNERNPDNLPPPVGPFASSPSLRRSFNWFDGGGEFVRAQTPSTLVFSQTPDAFKQALLAALQRFQDLAPFGYAATTGPLVFMPAPERFKQPYQDQLFSASFGFLAPSPFVPWNIPPWPEAFGKPFNASSQQASTYSGFTPALPGATPSAFGYSQSPDRFAVPFLAALQRFPDFTPAGTIVSVTPEGWFSDLSIRLAAPFIEKKFDGFVVPAAFQPYVFSISPERFILPFTEKKFDGFVTPATAAQTPSAFSAPQSPDLFAKPFSVSLQRFPDLAPFVPFLRVLSSYTDTPARTSYFIIEDSAGFILVPATTTPTTTSTFFGELSSRTIKPLSASLQQFGSFQPIGTITVPTTKKFEWIIRARRRHKR